MNDKPANVTIEITVYKDGKKYATNTVGVGANTNHCGLLLPFSDIELDNTYYSERERVYLKAIKVDIIPKMSRQSATNTMSIKEMNEKIGNI